MNGRIIMKNSELIDLLSEELIRKIQDGICYDCNLDEDL